jgi:hypothetical protein
MSMGIPGYINGNAAKSTRRYNACCDQTSRLVGVCSRYGLVANYNEIPRVTSEQLPSPVWRLLAMPQRANSILWRYLISIAVVSMRMCPNGILLMRSASISVSALALLRCDNPALRD